MFSQEDELMYRNICFDNINETIGLNSIDIWLKHKLNYFIYSQVGRSRWLDPASSATRNRFKKHSQIWKIEEVKIQFL